MLSNILIIDKRKELSTKYKKTLEDTETKAEIAGTLTEGIKLIQSLEPDMIIVSDSIDEPLEKFCEKIRALTYNTRPIIVALSKSADSRDRISVLESGADDFLSEPVNIDEFKTRIRAHIRRDIESNLDTKTLLPNKKIVEKRLRRIINSDNKPAVLLIGIENLRDYKNVYSEVAGDKLIQTLIAIAKSALDSGDFFGQLNDTDFIIITNRYSAENLAAFLTFAFDTVVPKFYTSEDAARGYMIMKSDGIAGMRANFVSVVIGGILDNYSMVKSVNALLERLYAVKNIAKIPSGSNYTIDRVRLTGENSVEESFSSNNIYIKETDEALLLLLRTTLELQGFDVITDLDNNSNLPPRVVIIDSGDDLANLDLCRKLKNDRKYVNTKIIVTTSVHDKRAVLDAGADLYLPKPYEISDLIRWIEYLKNLKD